MLHIHPNFPLMDQVTHYLLSGEGEGERYIWTWSRTTVEPLYNGHFGTSHF